MIAMLRISKLVKAATGTRITARTNKKWEPVGNVIEELNEFQELLSVSREYGFASAISLPSAWVAATNAPRISGVGCSKDALCVARRRLARPLKWFSTSDFPFLVNPLSGTTEFFKTADNDDERREDCLGRRVGDQKIPS